jgi:4-hydroxy-2-oxoheptanedioate aldolase
MSSHVRNPLRVLWDESRPAFGVWASIPSSFTAELVARAGPDYVCIDQQHSLVGDDILPDMLRAIAAAGPVPLVRVSANQPNLIGRALDLGSLGVIVPLVEDREGAAAAVAACRFPPHGTRSYGPIRASEAFGTFDPEILGGEVVCFAMVETQRGLDNLEEIASTPGLDGIYIGPADLALALGLPPRGDPRPQEHFQATQMILEACERNGIVGGMHCTGGEEARARAAQGFGLITATMDWTVLRAGIAGQLAVARALSS